MAESGKKAEKLDKDDKRKINKKSEEKAADTHDNTLTNEPIDTNTHRNPDTVEDFNEDTVDHHTDNKPEESDEVCADNVDEIQADTTSGEIIEDNDSIVSFTVKEDNAETGVQSESVSKVVDAGADEIVSYSEKAENSQTDKPECIDQEDVVIGVVGNNENHTSHTHDTQTCKQTDDSVSTSGNENEDGVENLSDNKSDIQEDEEIETDIEDAIDEVQLDISHYKSPAFTKKTGIFIPVILLIAAVVLLLIASIERRSAKKTIIEANKVADVIKQMLEDSLKEREQIIHSQIEGRELVIDALLLTRNGLELELTNTDEKEVKKIIGVFINDIDGRTKKIKSEIKSLRNNLKRTD